MQGSLRNTRRKPRSVASASSGLPGSVTATKRDPSPPVRSQKCAKCESVSIVPPDFDETTNTVRSRSTAPSSARTAAGSVESSTCRRSAPKERRSTSGASDEPPHAQQRDVPGVHLARPRRQRRRLGAHRVGDRQPAEAVGHLGRALRGPQGRVLGPDPPGDVLVAGARDARRDGALELARQPRLDGLRPAGHDRLALGLHPGAAGGRTPPRTARCPRAAAAR